MPKNLLSGYTDEAGPELDIQIRATQELGWKNLEMRGVQVAGFPLANLHDLPEKAFAQVVERLGEAGVHVHCFGSAIANGGKSIENPFEACWEEARRAVARMVKLGTRYIRIMSYPILHEKKDQMEIERFRRLNELQKLFHDSGLVMVHENCGNYGGMGWPFTLRLLENVPGLRLVFDMGNCVFDLDYSQGPPYPRQSSWEFYRHIREHIAHVHIKDGKLNAERHHEHVYPGEGEAEVKRILTDLLATGYTGAFSMEPHMGVAREFAESCTPEEGKFRTYVTYGKKLEALLASLT